VDRARAGEGPTLIEARTYRLAPHNTSDDSTRYVDPAELERARRRDPLSRLRALLTSRDLITEESERGLRDEVTEEVAAAVSQMEAESDFSAHALYEHVYAELPERLERHHRELADGGEERG
jgi:pyruvate dehydrogenase E1 component alpha subunit